MQETPFPNPAAGVEEISIEQLREIFDSRARRYFNLSGQLFLAKWAKGECTGPEWECDGRLAHLTMLIPMLSAGQ